jgi:hypothetical protein
MDLARAAPSILTALTDFVFMTEGTANISSPVLSYQGCYGEM